MSKRKARKANSIFGIKAKKKGLKRKKKQYSILIGRYFFIDLLFIIALVLSLFMFISLLTYSSKDIAFYYNGDSSSIYNYGGILGVFASDYLLLLFGFFAYFLPCLIIYSAYFYYRKFHFKLKINFQKLLFRSSGLLFLMIGLMLMSSFNGFTFYHYSFSGVVSDAFFYLLFPFVGRIGVFLLANFFCLVGILLSTGLSWRHLIFSIEKGFFSLRTLFYQLFYYLIAFFKTLRSYSVFVEKPDAKIEEEPSLGNEIIEQIMLHSAEQNLNEIKVEPIIVPPKVKIPETKKTLPEVQKDTEGSKLVSDGKTYHLGLELLDLKVTQTVSLNAKEEKELKQNVQEAFSNYGISVIVERVVVGPVIIMLELTLAVGVKVSRVSSLALDLARSLSLSSVRVVEIIPGKPYIGLEIPNEDRQVVSLHDVLSSHHFKHFDSRLAMALGVDISGIPFVVDLSKMPHLLVAGTTGSGKSVGVNAMILSLLYKSSPEDVRMIMIDPKMLELSVYQGIPHLLTDVVTDMKDASNALNWCVAEMERRYRLMSALGVRNINGYNEKILNSDTSILDPLWRIEESMQTQPPVLEKLPYIVVIVDEFADMIMIVGKKVEELIARIAQKARAAGIHLILATQRPSVDVITGLIKANIPARISFQVSSKIDSRTILDQGGAESLLGRGDMLYLASGSGHLTRVHGAFVSDDEVHKVAAYCKAQGEAVYVDAILNTSTVVASGVSSSGSDYDERYDEAVALVIDSGKVSISWVQRCLKVGYNRAARIVEQMEADGVVSKAGHSGSGQRKVLARKEGD